VDEMKNSEKIAVFFGTLLIKGLFYFVISIAFILLFWWAGITSSFNWRYVVVLTLGLMFLRVFIAEIVVGQGKK